MHMQIGPLLYQNTNVVELLQGGVGDYKYYVLALSLVLLTLAL